MIRNHSEKSGESCDYLSGKCLLHPNICQEQQYETAYSKIKACKPCELFKNKSFISKKDGLTMQYHCFPSVAHFIPDKYVVGWATQSSTCWQVPSRRRVKGKFTKLVNENEGGDHCTNVEEERGITQNQNKSAGSIRIGARIKLPSSLRKLYKPEAVDARRPDWRSKYLGQKSMLNKNWLTTTAALCNVNCHGETWLY